VRARDPAAAAGTLAVAVSHLLLAGGRGGGTPVTADGENCEGRGRAGLCMRGSEVEGEAKRKWREGTVVATVKEVGGREEMVGPANRSLSSV
jgi:hypothetical protein